MKKNKRRKMRETGKEEERTFHPTMSPPPPPGSPPPLTHAKAGGSLFLSLFQSFKCLRGVEKKEGRACHVKILFEETLARRL